MGRSLSLLTILLAAIACTGEVGGLGGGDAGSDAAPPDGARPDSSRGDSAMPPVDAGPCTAESLADALTITPIAGASAAHRVFGAPTAGGGAVAAWSGGDGVHVLTLDGSGAPVGAEVIVAGDRPYGLAVADDGTAAVMVDRGSDALYLVGTTDRVVFEERLLGEVDHDVTNNEWFGTGIRGGRLAWTGDRWAAYYTLQRLWDDGVAHYGDQLRLLQADGSADRTIWGWGCSHSMEVRIAHDGSDLGPLCASDCFPDKGVYFDHNTQLYTDSRANCSGGHTAHLGGIVPAASGFVAAFTVGDGRSSEDLATVRIGSDGRPSEVVFLTDTPGDESAPNMAALGDGLVLGWISGSASMLQRTSIDGVGVGSPESVPAAALERASDFFTFEGGDAGWLIGDRSGVSLARLRDCN